MSKPHQVFYAVGIGLKTGVFTSPSESLKPVEGVRNFQRKKFKSEKDAWAFVKSFEGLGEPRTTKKANKLPSPVKKPPSPAKKPPSPAKKQPRREMLTRSQTLERRTKSSIMKRHPQNYQQTTKPELPVSPKQKNPKISSANQSQQIMESDQKDLKVHMKRPATTINTSTQKRARINSGEHHGLQRPLHIFFNDDFAESEKAIGNSGLEPPHDEKKPEGQTEPAKLKEELERLKEKQAKMESEILKIVQHIQEKTEGMEILKAEIASVERRVALFEAGKPSSLQEAVSRIRRDKEPEPRKEPKVKKPQSKVEQPKKMRAESFVHDEISDDCEVLENEKCEGVWSNDHSKYNFDMDGFCNIYTDGLCLYNRISGPRAGMGVFFGDENNYNMSEPLTGCQPTNHNAAIQAAALACNVAKLTGITMINIHLDSKFVMSCVKDVMPTWETRDALPEENEAQLLLLTDAMEGLNVRWTFVEPRSTVHGSMMARKLAKEGAEKQ